MSLVTPSSNDVFLLDLSSYSLTNPGQIWHNNLTVYAKQAASLTSLRTCAYSFGLFIRHLYYPGTFAQKVRVSTWAEDSKPYQGNEFTNVDILLAGSRPPAASDALSLETCLYVKKVTQVGRNGKLFVRGALTEGDVKFGESLFAPQNPEALEQVIIDAAEVSGFDAYLSNSDPNWGVCIAKEDAGDILVRPLVGVSLGGIRSVNMNKKYYDRKPVPVPTP